MSKEEEETKEPFCGACVAGVAALAGAGAAKSSDNLGKTQKSKRIIFWISITVTLLSILYLVYQLWFSNCSECA